MIPWSRSKEHEVVPENVDVEENGGICEDDNGVFVTENKRNRRSFGAREITLAAIAFAIFAGSVVGTGYGISRARGRSSSKATAFVDEQPQGDTSYPMADLTVVEEAAVTDGGHLHHGGHDHDHRHDDHGDHLDVRPSQSSPVIETDIGASNVFCVCFCFDWTNAGSIDKEC